MRRPDVHTVRRAIAATPGAITAGRLAALVAIVLIVGACAQAPAPTAELDLTGTWTLVRSSESSTVAFGTTGDMTISFAAADGGGAGFIGIRAASGMTVCRAYEAELVGESVLFLREQLESEVETWGFVLERRGADEVVLSNERETFTATRVAGSAPLAPCGTVTVASSVDVAVDRPSRTTLSAVGDRLYFNTGSGNPIVGYSLSTESIVSSRSFTSLSSDDRFVVAALGDDEFVGQCACGRSRTVTRFDLEANALLVRVNTDDDLGVPMIVRYGYATDDHVVIGGAEDADALGSSVNVLATLDRVTLDLVAQRTILDGVAIVDVAMLGAELYAITSEWEVVRVGDDGRASATYALPDPPDAIVRGIAAVGDALYVLTVPSEFADAVTLLRLELP